MARRMPGLLRRVGSSRPGPGGAMPGGSLRCEREFPASPAQVPKARRFLAAILGDSRATDDALVCLSELVTNSIQHSRSAKPGGTFTVRASVAPGSVQVEVEDQGGPWQMLRHPPGQRGRGLQIVSQLAASWGISGDGSTRTVSFQIELP